MLLGCIGRGPVSEEMKAPEVEAEIGEPLLREGDIAAVALTREELGTGTWTVTTENWSEEMYEIRFIMVEATFGAASRLVNRVHLYPDIHSALEDYKMLVESLETFPTSKPNVGEEALLWTRGSFGYLAFVRGNVVVEFEYTSPTFAEDWFLIELAEIVDSKIKGG